MKHEKFIVSSYNTDPCFLYRSHPSKLTVRQIVIQNKYLHTIDHWGNVRYTKPHHIIIAPLTLPGLYTHEAFDEFLAPSLKPFTVIVFIVEPKIRQIRLNILYHALPATKIFLYLNPPNSKIWVICHRYCVSHPQPLSKPFMMTLLLDPMKFHKSHFWNGNGRSMIAHTDNVHQLYFESFPGNPLMCFTLLKMMTRTAAFCNQELMSTISLEPVHNITIFLLNPHNPADRRPYIRTFAKQSFQILTGHISYESRSLNHIARLLLSRYYYEVFVYCTGNADDDGNGEMELLTFQLSLWATPFTSSVWILVGILIIGSALGYSKWNLTHFLYSELFRSFAAFMGNSSSKQSRTSLILILCGMLLLGLYENDILSLVSTKYPPRRIETLEELLDLGYKILNSVGYPEKKYEMDFKLSNVVDRINTSFYYVSPVPLDISGSIGFSKYLKKSNEKQRFAAIASDLSLHNHKSVYQQEIIDQGGSPNTKCHHVPQRISKSILFSDIYTVNMYWLKQSLSKMREAGLKDKWDEWSLWWVAITGGYAPEEKLGCSNKVEVGFNSIGLAKLLILLPSLACLVVFSLLIFLTELIIGNCGYNEMSKEYVVTKARVHNWLEEDEQAFNSLK
ncbi:unnamed protein product [Orchesella dallaii]|uniref:Uncharacterized protein n=1 Tax=Orchesella dallaii TaxID=48710 RepID=A0ABP1Q7C7_9HEXA